MANGSMGVGATFHLQWGSNVNRYPSPICATQGLVVGRGVSCKRATYRAVSRDYNEDFWSNILKEECITTMSPSDLQ